MDIRPNKLPIKGVAIPRYDIEQLWELVGFAPHSGQREIFNGWIYHQQTTAVCGTRFGKSEFGSHLPLSYIAPCYRFEIKDGKQVAVEHRTSGAVIAPIYKLTQIVMGKLLVALTKLQKPFGYGSSKVKKQTIVIEEEEDTASKDWLPPEPGALTVRKIAGVIREIITPWGSRVQSFTMDDPRSLLGLAFDWIVTDESGQFSDDNWNDFEEYALRALLDFKGWVYHGTTPKGFNKLYDDVYLPGVIGSAKKQEHAISFQMSTYDNPYMDTAEIERIRKRSNPRIFAQNFLAQFQVMDGQVYEEFTRQTHVREFKPDVSWEYFMGMDFGYTDPFISLLAAWTGREFVVVAEAQGSHLHAAQQFKMIRDMIRKHKPAGSDWLLPTHAASAKASLEAVWGDPRGGQGKAELVKLGLPIRTPRMFLRAGQKGSIDETAQVVSEYVHPEENAAYPAWCALPSDAGKPSPRFFVHPRCTTLIHSMETWVKKGTTYYGDDHGCFVAGTLVWTDRGSMPIEAIRSGDRVQTRQGMRRVVDAGMTSPDAEVYELRTSEGHILRGTGNHPIAMRFGFTPLRLLESGDLVVTEQAAKLKNQPPVFVHTSVASVKPYGRAAVFNLTVEGVPEYVANGIVSHNCDAIRYGLIGARPHCKEHQGRTPRAQLDPVEPPPMMQRGGFRRGQVSVGRR